MRKEDILPFISDNVDGLRVFYAKWDKSGRDRYYITSLTCDT